MNIVGIIAEYNPFHNGHFHQIQQTKSLLGCDGIVCVISPNFVQRGEPAIFDKQIRTKSALLSGADLILELPTPFALSSADRFALGGISVLSSLGIISHLCFGSECGDIKLLTQTAEAIENKEVREFAASMQKKGLSFAVSRQNSIAALYPELNNILSSPNNILGVEYIRAIKSISSSIKPFTIKRFGTDYHDLLPVDKTASAASLRSSLSKMPLNYVSDFIPNNTFEVFKKAYYEKKYTPFKNYHDLYLSALKRISNEDLINIPDVTEGLENRIKHAAINCSTWNEFIMAAGTKRYPTSRLRRIAACCYLNINKKDTPLPLSYIRVLGFNDIGKAILANCRKTSSLPLITKPAHANRLGERAKKALKIEISSTSLYYMGLPKETRRSSTPELQQGPVII